MPSIDEVRALAARYPDPLKRAQRVYLDEPSHAMEGKHDSEFAIKQEVAEYFKIPFRHVAFTGSAQLGFSPTKGTMFEKGRSDLDIACVDQELFQRYWIILNQATRAFNDISGFSIHKDPKRAHDELREMIVKRGVLYHWLMPKCHETDRDAAFLDSLTKDYTTFFGKITIGMYMNEYAFCWKQNSALQIVLRS